MKSGMRWHGPALLALIALPFAANLLVLTGVLHNDPALFTMFLTRTMGPRPLLAAPGWFDPTIGLITQPLGMLSAKDWLHGIVPWWNPYTGVGMPLAAEMQTLSFFLPFVLVLKFWPGWLVLKLMMQILCGLFMYALLIELRLTRLAALVGGALYALNATFFLVPHVMGPLPFAPLLLLGIERAARAARDGRGQGWGLIPPALAYLIYGGYPEVAYIEATLAAVWTLWRFANVGSGARARFAGKIALGGALGIALALPLLVPFLAYVRTSYLGIHATKYAWLWLLPPGVPVQLFPFVYGPIGGPTPPGLNPALANTIAAYWVQSAGWFGPVAACLALAALARPARLRGLALLLFGFILIWQARIWGFKPAIWLIDLIPMMARTDAMRFCAPAMELACFIMAAIAFDAWQVDGALPRRRVISLSLAATAIGAISIGVALPALSAWFTAVPGRLDLALGVTLAEAALAIGAVLILRRQPGGHRGVVLAALVIADPLGLAVLTTLGAPRSAALDFGGVTYLQRHARLARMYSLQPFGPNFPAAFGVASIDDNASPVSAAWNRYIHRHLDRYADVVMFTGSQARALGCVLLPRAAAALDNGIFIRPTRAIIPPDQSAELRRHIAAYRAIGVKYVVSPPGHDPFVAHATLPVSITARSAFALSAGGKLSGVVPAGLLGISRISEVDTLIGTYAGAARGTLRLKLCAGADCATASAPLAGAKDNGYLALPLDHPLTVAPAQPLRYRFTHRTGSAVALWLGDLQPDAPATLAVAASAPAQPPQAPILRFVETTPGIAARPVFQDQVMRIYRLEGARRFFSATPSCRITPSGFDRLTTDCPAAATLVRLEAADAGWHATVDGHDVPIATVSALFQSIAVPAGRSDIRFFYRPPFIRSSCAAALAALAIWLFLIAGLPALTAGRRRPPFP
jgi:Bacterial membrane protein YfhO.